MARAGGVHVTTSSAQPKTLPPARPYFDHPMKEAFSWTPELPNQVPYPHDGVRRRPLAERAVTGSTLQPLPTRRLPPIPPLWPVPPPRRPRCVARDDGCHSPSSEPASHAGTRRCCESRPRGRLRSAAAASAPPSSAPSAARQRFVPRPCLGSTCTSSSCALRMPPSRTAAALDAPLLVSVRRTGWKEKTSMVYSAHCCMHAA